MANQCAMTVRMSATSGSATISTGTLSKTSTSVASPPFMQSGNQLIGTTPVEQLTYNSTDITGNVNIAITNLDATNYVTIYKEVGGTNVLSVLQPGQTCLLLGVPATGLYAQAHTANVQIQFWMTQV